MTKQLLIALLASLVSFSYSSLYAQEEAMTPAKAYNNGLAKLKEKNYSEGLRLMEKAIRLAIEVNDEKVIGLARKNGAVAATQLGGQSYKAGHYDAALALYEKGIGYAPDKGGNYLGKARCLSKKGRSLDAISAFMRAGQVYEQAGKSGTGVKAYQQAQTLVGKTFVSKDYDNAIVYAEAYLKSYKSAEVYYYLSKSLLKTGDNDKALENIKRSIGLSDDEDKYFMTMGQILENLGEKTKALAAYQKVSGEKFKKHADYRISALQGN